MLYVLKEWQQTVFDLIKKLGPYDNVEEHINIIVGYNNPIDRNILRRKCKNEKVAFSIEVNKSYKEIYTAILNQPRYRAYIIEIHNYIQGDELMRVLNAIKNIKLGSIQYEHIDLDTEPTNIWIYIDNMPDFDSIYGFTCIFWKIVDSKLVKI